MNVRFWLRSMGACRVLRCAKVRLISGNTSSNVSFNMLSDKAWHRMSMLFINPRIMFLLLTRSGVVQRPSTFSRRTSHATHILGSVRYILSSDETCFMEQVAFCALITVTGSLWTLFELWDIFVLCALSLFASFCWLKFVPNLLTPANLICPQKQCPRLDWREFQCPAAHVALQYLCFVRTVSPLKIIVIVMPFFVNHLHCFPFWISSKLAGWAAGSLSFAGM